MQKVTPFLWFDSQAEDAAKYYVEVFKNAPYASGESKIVTTTKYTTDTPSNKPKGSVMTVTYVLSGTEFTAINGGSFFTLSEAVSFVIPCKDQAEIDYFWEKLSAVGASEQCGWCKDKFGLSWQITPENIGELINNEKSMQAMMQMKKIEIKKLQEASEGK